MKKEKLRFFAYHHDPNARTFQVAARMKDVPGALESVLGLLMHHLNLIGSVSYTIDDHAIWSGLGTALSKTVTEAELKKLLSTAEMVEDSEVHENEDGFIVDTFHSGIQMDLGEPYILFPVKGISKTYDHLVEIFGSGGETILFDEGVSLGKINGRYFVRLLGGDLARMKIHQFATLYSAFGWGSTEIAIEKSGAEFVVGVADCFECSLKKSARRDCNFMRGHFQGWLSTVFESDLFSEETKCRLRGDPLCEFHLVQK